MHVKVETKEEGGGIATKVGRGKKLLEIKGMKGVL